MSSVSTDVYAGEKDTYIFRLRKIEAIVVRIAMWWVLTWGTQLRNTAVNFLDYLKSKDDEKKTTAKFKKKLYPLQEKLINNDLTGKTYDTSLLFACITFVCDGLAPVGDDKWKNGSSNLESLVTSAKDFRNVFAHDQPDINKIDFLVRTENIRKILKDMIMAAQMLYKISSDIADKVLKEIDDKINYLRDSSLVPQNYMDYQKLPLFYELQNLMKTNGFAELSKLLDEWDFVSPISKMTDIKFKVDTVYTDMIITNDKGHMKQALIYEDIFKGCCHDTNDPVILVEGIAGVGKSTLTKKILGEWVSGLCSLKELKDFDLLFFSEFRNNSITNFTELVKAMMTEVAKCFMGKELEYTVLSLNTLVIIDGLDEMNKVSLQLFKELLNLKKYFGNLTLLVTTRPERVVTYYNLVSPFSIKTKYIHLKGIHESKREEFVIKYHDEMAKNGICCGDIDRLLQYLERTKNRLDHLWKLPFNLTLLCIMWNKDPILVSNITTATELYWQIHLGSLNKLKERLRYTYLCILSELELDDKVNYFIFRLSREALIGLQREEINLGDESVKRLFNVCIHKGLPADEMIGAFLKKNVMKTVSGWETRFTFIHKGFQDFLSALYLWKILQGKNSCFDVEEITKEVQSVLDSKDIPTHICQDIMVYIDDCLKRAITIPSASDPPGATPKQENVIRNLLTNGDDFQPILKFQNVLQILIGLFYIENKDIREDNKLEVLKLLEESGIKGRDQWLNILNSVNSDDFVIKFISKVPGIMEGTVGIEDTNVFAYTSLFRVSLPAEVKLIITGDPKEIPRMTKILALISEHGIKVKDLKVTDINVHEFSVGLVDADIKQTDIDLNTDLSTIISFNEFLQNICSNKSTVTHLLLHHYFRKPSSSLPFESTINEILKQCEVQYYVGSVTALTKFSKCLCRIQASVTSRLAYENFLDIVTTTATLQEFKLCIPLSVDPDDLQPMPDKGMVAPSLYIPDVSDDTSIDAAVSIARKLQPITGPKTFLRISFPRAVINGDQQGQLLQGLKGINVTVSGGILLPNSCSPTNDQQLLLQQLTKEEIKSSLKWESKESMWR